jgi:signal peptidase II
LRRLARIGLVTLTLFGCIGCDQVSKGLARSHLAVGDMHSYLHDLLRLTHAENSGAFLGLGDALPEHARAIVFTWRVGFLCLAPLVAALFARSLSLWQVTGLALFAAGGFGNWIDRITRHGHVMDFLNVGLGPLRTGIFNVADMVLMTGAVVVLLAGHGGGLLTRDESSGRPVASRAPGEGR